MPALTPELAGSFVALVIALMTYIAARLTAASKKTEAAKADEVRGDQADTKAARQENNGYLERIAESLERMADDIREIRILYGARKD